MQLHVEMNEKYVADPGTFGSEDSDTVFERKIAGQTRAFFIPKGTRVMVTPNIDENYWMMRVPVSKKQAIVCFEKFSTIGIGFQIEEEDWNTNLHWLNDAEKIYEHIKVNKGQRHITRQKCIDAIQLLQAHIAAHLAKQEGVVEH